jgi:hypothetical protein
MLSKRDRKARLRSMERVYELRRDNLRLAVNYLFNGSFAALALRLAVDPARITHLIGPNPVATISEKTARGIEEQLQLPAGWLDLAR